MDWVAEKKFRTSQVSLDYRTLLAAKAAELRQAARNGETADGDRVLSIADALESSASGVGDGDTALHVAGCRLWG